MGRHFGQAVQGLEGARRLSRQLSGATLLVLLAVIFTVAVALLWATHESDTASVQRQERIARNATDVALDELSLQQETVSIWDESALRMVSPEKDQQWLFDNVGSWLHRMFEHDETWMLYEHDRPVQVVVRGRPAPLRHYWHLRSDVRDLIAAARGDKGGSNGQNDRNPGSRVPAGSTVQTPPRAAHDTQLTVVGGRPAAASAMLIQPSTPGYVGKRSEWPVLVSIRYLDRGLARDLQAKHLIDLPRFRRTDNRTADEHSLLIKGESGESLGFLIWTPDMPGSRIITALLPANLRPCCCSPS